MPGLRRCRPQGLILGLAVTLVACASEPPPAPEPPPPQIAKAEPTRVPPRSTPAFCGVLTELVEAEPTGFAGLRGRAIGTESWTGKTRPPGTERCVIEGAAWPRARYACAGRLVPAAERERLDNLFAAMSQQIDSCLGKSSWYPRHWQKNEPFDFAMGERQQTWTDLSSLPPSAVVLKLQQGVSGRDYRVQLDLLTIR
jgi:hypothetical protein